MILRVIADSRILGPLHGAAFRRQIAHQRFQQRGFTDAVGAQHRQLFAHFQHQIQVAEQRAVIEAFGQRFHFQRIAEQFLILLEADKRVLTAGGFYLVQLDLINLFSARRRLTGLGGVGAEAADEGLQLGDLRLFLGVVGQQTLARLSGGGHIFVVVARIDAQLAVVEIRHMGADHIQEVTVVRNDDHGAVALVQHLLQPADSVDIQVVGRFIEQQNIGVGEQRLRQQHAQLPARRDFAHRAVVLLHRNAYAQQQFAGARFGGVAIHFAILHFQVGDLVAILFAHFRQRIDAVALLLHLPQFVMSHNDGVQHAEFFKRELILTQLTDTFVRIAGDVAGGWH